jgi:Ca2+-binding EF-hand superfamily protein
MNRKILVAALCGAAIAIPALAVGAQEMHEHMSGPISRSQVEAMVKEHFAKADTNGDGYIVKAEADAARDKMMADMRDRHFKMMDTNGDGSISRAEFDAHHAEGMDMGGMMEGGEGHHRGMGMMMMGKGGGMFERADADKDGRVSLAEALAVPMAMFDKADTNKDGTVTPEERKAAHQKMREAWHAKRG